MTSASLVEVQGLTKTFGGVTALDRVDFSVETGQIAGLIGPNGAGKSTFFNVLTGVFAGESGEIRFDGKRINAIRPHSRVKMGMVRTFQKIHPFHGMTVLESVMVGCHTQGSAGLVSAMIRLPSTNREEDHFRQASEAALKFVGLTNQLEAPADALPLGHQRLLQIACALVTEPRVMLLDEPASGLDNSETARLADLLLAIRAQGKTIVLVEHDMSLVMKICDRITVLSFGKRLSYGTPDEVRHDPMVIEAYLGGSERSA